MNPQDSSKESFIRQLAETGPRLLEVLLQQSSPEGNRQVPPGSLFTSKRLAEAANNQTQRLNVSPITSGEVPYALAPYVSENIVGVHLVYGGNVPCNGEDPGREYAFEILNAERAREITKK